MHSQASRWTPEDGGAAGGLEATPTPRWRLRLLGAFELSDGRLRLTRLPSRPMVALLARLALAPGRAHPREELAELLWPGVEPLVSRNRLRHALSVLRSVLEPADASPAQVLMADRFELRLVPGSIACDVLAFEHQARHGPAEQALALYRGELLPGFFDEWVLDERRRLEAVSLRLAEQIAEQRPRPGADGAGSSTPAVSTAPTDTLPAAAGAIPATAPGNDASPWPTRAELPAYLTRLHLDAAQFEIWRSELSAHRLVTLLGPGGAGKTRLAVELARVAAPADGVAFVALVAVQTRAQAIDAITAALGIANPGAASADELEPLARALHGRPLLLVLDNFEQLVDEAADLLARLAGRLPLLRLLVTSRRALGIDGERALPVPPLPLPGLAQGRKPLERAHNPAVALFVDRARQVRPDFQLDDANTSAVIRLVHVLEGLPLAIEMAASRVRSLTPADILELLVDGGSPRLELLSRSGPRGALDARHSSMQRVVGWSWQQLSIEGARMMHALAVFGGGCSAAAAAAVRGVSPLAAAVQLDALVACSMVRASEAPWGEMRFDLYAPIRDYTLVDLRQTAGAGAEAGLRAAHRAWMLEWAEALPSTPPLAAMLAEFPNLSIALHSALADGDAVTAVRTVLALGRAHDDLVLGADALARFERAVLRCDDAELRSRGHTQLAQLCFAAARSDEARHHAELGLEQVPDDASLRARALHVKARVQWLLQGYAPWLDPCIDEAEALAKSAQDTQALARLTVLRAAITYAHRGDMAGGERLYRQALALWERLGNRHAINAGRYFVALVVQAAGRNHEALQRADEVLASARQLADTRRASQALQVRAKALGRLRRWPEAAATLRESVQLAWDVMAPVELIRALRDLPAVLAHLRRAEAAVRLQAYAARAAAAHVGRADGFDVRQERRVRRLVARRLEPGRWEALRREGEALDIADAVMMALDETR